MKTSFITFFSQLVLIFFLAIFSIQAQNTDKLGLYERPDLYWMQVSNEYENVTKSLYLLAKIQLDENLKNREKSAFLEQKNDFKYLPSAIIMDIDETILNNTNFAVYMQTDLKNIYSRELWDSYVKQEISMPISGSVDFINYVASKGVKVFLVSNRTQGQLSATINNLKQIGVKIPKEQIMLVGGKPSWNSNKYHRYDEIAKNYYIAMIIGDNMTDFLIPFAKGTSYKKYKELNKKYAVYIGKYWIQLPDPTYGSWQNITGINKEIKTFAVK